MKAHDLLVVAAVTLVTSVLGVLVIGPGQTANAVPENAIGISSQGTLEIDQVELGLQPKRSLRPGDRPVLALAAANNSRSPRQVRVEIAMSAREPISPYSRRVSLPVQLWKQECLVRLAPGEKKTIELDTGTPVEAGREILLVLRSGSRQVLAAALAVGDRPALLAAAGR